MSFIRRNGAVVYNGPHVGSRGSLSEVQDKNPMNYDEPQSEEDEQWMLKVANNLTSLSDSFLYDVDDYTDDADVDSISRLFGVYNKQHEPQFNRNCFFRTE